VQPPGDHEVKHQPRFAVQADGDALAEAAQFHDPLAFDRREGRVEAAEQEWTVDANAFQGPTLNATLQGLDVQGNVGQLGHGSRAAVVGSREALLSTSSATLANAAIPSAGVPEIRGLQGEPIDNPGSIRGRGERREMGQVGKACRPKNGQRHAGRFRGGTSALPFVSQLQE
jgi:hypothetical protein